MGYAILQNPGILGSWPTFPTNAIIRQTVRVLGKGNDKLIYNIPTK